MTGLSAGEIFFVDDRPENVTGALEAGLDAVLYTSPACLAADLRRRGIGFNY
jgi:FMN phosphatase YigB (HAD superfamily)